MKKVIAIILILCLLPIFAIADIDLSSMSYDELVKLKEQINLSIWNSEEWQEVTVPAGIWEIGADIPAGYWTVTPDDAIIAFWYGDKLNESKTDVGYGWDIKTGVAISLNGRIEKDGSWTYPKEQHQISIDMKEGMYIKVTGSVIFTPYTGKPDLGFK